MGGCGDEPFEILPRAAAKPPVAKDSVVVEARRVESRRRLGPRECAIRAADVAAAAAAAASLSATARVSKTATDSEPPHGSAARAPCCPGSGMVILDEWEQPGLHSCSLIRVVFLD